ncbi:MAG: bifunctional YncE family protein/alkaline phosphatase family protein [Phycisphaerales bacterium]|nr:MAG: bifunctional YncE family protein/alkaline phosphatase family protein [Phycisphaerales bacterium]
MRFVLGIVMICCCYGATVVGQQGTSSRPAAVTEYDAGRVGPLADGRVIVPTNQVLAPAGWQVNFAGRPTDLALSPDGRHLAALGHRRIVVIDIESRQVVQEVSYATPKGGGSFTGISYTPDGKRLYASCIRGTIEVFGVGTDGRLTAQNPIPLKGRHGRNTLPAGLEVTPDGRSLYVALNLNNTLGEIDLGKRELIREIPVGNAPYDVVLVGRQGDEHPSRAVVSNWAGRLPTANDPVGPSGRGTPVKVDPVRHIASEGSVSIVDLKEHRVIAEIVVGRHASGLSAGPTGVVYVANANSDTVSVIDAFEARLIETISTRPDGIPLFGSAPNALVERSGRLYVSNGTNNSVAVVQLGEPTQGHAPSSASTGDAKPRSMLVGHIPTGWYPAGIVHDSKRNALCVVNVKGIGSRATAWRGKRKIKGKTVFGYNSHDYSGTISIIPIPGDDDLAAHTKQVLTNNRMTQAISALSPPRAGIAPRPVPQRHGEPSVIRHVVYIIKENRTYDQVFGDLPQGEGDPSLCIFGRDVTPNHHRLAEQFVLFDNFYCSGTLSADGHQWTDEAYVTDYIEKSYGGWPRSYPYAGGDALAYAESGFIWDNVLAHGKTLRVYGEFVTASIKWRDPGKPDAPSFLECYQDFVNQTDLIEIRATANLKTLEPYICPTFIGFPYNVPDVYRAGEFIKELQEFERAGTLPDFCIMLLPNDHTAGTRPGRPTPAAAVADNDLALGRIVEAISHSSFWKETCIFVVQDDPQNGFDHIDGHRTVALVISPFTKRRYVDSTNYNQTSMFKTMELLLGLPPLNQFDAAATPMTTCFTDSPDFTPYDAVPNRIPLDQLNPPVQAIRDPAQRKWALKSLELPLDDVDRADEDTLNRILWHAAKGNDASYPEWAVLAVPADDEDGV